MEQERIAREQEEKENAEKQKKIKEQFGDTNGQWEKDKTEMQNLALKDKTEKASKEMGKDTTGASPKEAAAAVAAEEKPAAKKDKVGGAAAIAEES